ncbi:MAG: hypothetical protein IJ228_11060 [Succinivibrio sp.]|nr:hypothetical protein [Succinivibrio sp.]
MQQSALPQRTAAMPCSLGLIVPGPAQKNRLQGDTHQKSFQKVPGFSKKSFEKVVKMTKSPLKNI